MAWSVVHFKDDNAVEVVPDFWFDSRTGKCAWPTENSSRFIEKRQMPNESFKYYKARVFSGCEHMKNILEAREKCKLAEHTSDLDGLSSKKRKVRKKINFNSSSSCSSPEPSALMIDNDCPILSSDSDIAGSPIRHKNSLLKNSKYVSPTKDATPNSSRINLAGSPIRHKNSLLKNSKYVSPTKDATPNSSRINLAGSPIKHKYSLLKNSKYVSPTKDATPNSSRINLAGSPIRHKNSLLKNSKYVSPTKDATPNSSRINLAGSPIKHKYSLLKNSKYVSPTKDATINSSRINLVITPVHHRVQLTGNKSLRKRNGEESTSLSESDFRSKMLKSQLITKYEIKSMNEKLDTILQIVERLENSKTFYTYDESINSAPDYSAMDSIFPIDNESDLNSLNEQIELDSVYKKKLIKDLSLSGGNELKKLLKRIMNKLFSDDLLQYYSFVGRGTNKKKCFSDLPICKVIFESIKVIPKYENCIQEMEDKLKIYLAQAPFRLKRATKI